MTAGLAILAVDDEPRALTDIKRLLETSASVERVATATSAKDALVYLSGGRYAARYLLNESRIHYQVVPRKPEDYFSPAALAAEGVR